MKLLFTCYAKRLAYVLIFCSSILSSQKKQDSILASNLIVEGDSLANLWQLPLANSKFKQALRIYENNENWENMAKCYNKIGEVGLYSEDYDDAYKNSQMALNLLENKITKPSIEIVMVNYILATYYGNKEYNFEKSLEFYNKAIDHGKELFGENDELLAKTYNAVGILHSKNGKYRDAIPFYEKSVEIRMNFGETENPQVAEGYGNMGLNYNAMGEYEKSIEYQTKALNIDIRLNGEDNPNAAFAYVNMAKTYQNLLEIDRAIFYNQKALPIVLKKLGETHSVLAIIYQDLSSQYGTKGEPNRALDFSKKALDVMTISFGENHPKTITALKTLGSVYNLLGENQKAMQYTQRALEIGKKVFGPDHIRMGGTYSKIAKYNRKEKNYEFALLNDYKALSIFIKEHGNLHPIVGDTYMHLGNNYEKLENDSLALKSYKKSYEIYNMIAPKNHFKIAKSLNVIGEFYLSKNNYNESENYFEEALELLNDKTQKNSQEDFIGEESIVQGIYLKLYNNKARSVFESKEKTAKELREVTKLYKSADSIIDHMWHLSQYAEDKIHFTENIQKIYHNAIEVNLNNLTSDRVDFKEAFYYAEKSRFNLLKELVNENDAISFAGFPEEIQNKEDSLKIKRAYYTSKLASFSNDTKISNTEINSSRNKLFNVNRQYDSLLGIIKKDYPNYFDFKHSEAVLSVENIQKKLENETAFIEYVYTSDKIYAFVVTADSFRVQVTPKSSVSEKITRYIDAIDTKDIQEFKKLGYELYVLLVKPILGQLKAKELIIVPDGPLWNLNFELLSTQLDTTNDPREFSYLLRDYAISYANSATLQFRNTGDDITSNECLAFSFSDTENSNTGDNLRLSKFRDSKGDLPGTRKEIREISKIVDGAYYYGNQATESNFKLKSGNYGILHLALHGELNDTIPGNSKLYFTKGQDSIEDGNLYSHELFALKIRAELAVLSACNSGSGKLTNGEGIMSIGNAFQYAGTKSLLMSRWVVLDDVAPELMKLFYQNLKDGMSKSEALQKAKLSFIKKCSLNRVHPFYWSSFYLVGDITPIELSKDYTIYYIGIVVLIFILWFAVKMIKSRFAKREEKNRESA